MIKRNPEAQCDNCPYFEKGNLFEQGDCRRNAPIKGVHNGQVVVVSWPQVTVHHVCGQHPDFLLNYTSEF